MHLGVTRSEAQLKSLIEASHSKDVTILPLPLTDVEYLPFELPAKLQIESIDWLVFTSGNGVRSFIEQLDTLGHKLPVKTKIAVVGPKTAQVLTELTGREADLMPKDTYGELLCHHLIDTNNLDGKTVVYVRAEKVSFEPAGLIAEAGAKFFSIVSYRAINLELDSDLPAMLTEEDYCLFTAPSKVRAFNRQFGRPICRLIAMGRSTAKTMNEVGWFGFSTLKIQDINSVLEYI